MFIDLFKFYVNIIDVDVNTSALQWQGLREEVTKCHVREGGKVDAV